MCVTVAALILEPSHHSFWITLILGWSLAGVLMWVASRMAGVRYVSLGKSLFISFVASGITLLSMFVFSEVPVAGTSLGLLMSIAFTWVLVKESFATSLLRSLLVWGMGAIPIAVFGAFHIA